MLFLVHNIANYKFEGNSLEVDYIEMKNDIEIGSEHGIKCIQQAVDKNIINSLERAINSGHLVIIWIDAFYESMRRDTYHMRHQPHAMMVYGYDDEKMEFVIMEHSNADSVDYMERVISYQELFNCYFGYIKHFNEQEEATSYYEFLGGDNIKNDFDCIEIYKENLRKCRGELESGLNQLNKAIQVYDSMEEENSIRLLSKKINTILNSKKCNVYMFSELFGEDNEYTRNATVIYELWESVRRLVLKTLLAEKNYEKTYTKIMQYLKEIYNHEVAYLEKIKLL